MVFIGKELWFPDVELAEEDGLLAVGGDLSPERLLLAYRSGIFPWFIESGLVFWYCPEERFVLYPDEIRISDSMKRVMNKGEFEITENKDFKEVIKQCASTHRFNTGSTWITDEFIHSYSKLHNMHQARSVEVWANEKLVGGLYGVEVGTVFCGESMFSTVSNASKIALIHLCQSKRYGLIDCQVHTPHLESMGARMISRDLFLKHLMK
jgi:leucyl/phenylalanyl-tRNA--protein transferase